MEPLDKAAQERVATIILVAGLVDVALLLLAVLAPLVRAKEVTEASPWGYVSALPAPLFVAAALAGAVYLTMTVHYSIRFIWGRGQSSRLLYSVGWHEHEALILAQMLVGLAFAFVWLFLVPHPNIFGSGL